MMTTTLVKSQEHKGVDDLAVQPLCSKHDDVLQIMFTREQIAERIVELGRQVAQDYDDKAPVIMPILKGGFIVAADFVRALDPVPEGMMVEFVQASSYGAGTETSGRVEVSFNTEVVKGRHVLMVDDLCDSGLTLLTVHQLLVEAGVASVKSLVLLDKVARRKVEYTPDYIGFPCPNVWIVGNGMDTAQLYRSLGYIGSLKPEVQKKFMTK